MTAGEIVRSFMERISAMDLGGATALLASGFVWENVPMHPPANRLLGGDAMAHRLTAVFRLCDRIAWRIIEQAEDGGTVLHERLDEHWFIPGTFPKSDYLAAPVASVWKVADGRIALWRDYFDLGLFENQTGMSLADFGRLVGRNYGSDGRDSTLRPMVRGVSA